MDVLEYNRNQIATTTAVHVAHLLGVPDADEATMARVTAAIRRAVDTTADERKLGNV